MEATKSALTSTGKAMKNMGESIKYKLTGQKYHDSLMGEGLQDVLRKATAKTLEVPDAEFNKQAVLMINEEVEGGKDPKEIVALLKARLRMDNPQKQYLAVMLVEQILTDCSRSIGLYQNELLQEVARVMAKPAKPETDAGKCARRSAKELLRKYGQAGTTAFRAVHNEPRAGGAAMAVQGGYGLTGYTPAPIGYPPPQGYPGGPYGMDAMPGAIMTGGGGARAAERQSTIEEVRQLIDKARSNSELLSEMLVNSAGASDDFEAELIKDLASEVAELREVFNAYLGQISAMEGADAEELVVQALGAVDQLDAVMALRKDVELNQHELASSAAALTPAARAPAPSSAAAASSGGVDLIGFDDLAEALTASAAIEQQKQQQISAGGSLDPFAASSSNDPFAELYSAPRPGQETRAPDGPLGGHAVAMPPSAADIPAAPAVKQSAFANMFSQPGGTAAFASLAGTAPPPAVEAQQYPPMQYPATPGYTVPLTAHQQQPFYGSPPPHSHPAALAPQVYSQYAAPVHQQHFAPPSTLVQAASNNPFVDVPGSPALLNPVYPVNPVFDASRSPVAAGGAHQTNNPFSGGGAAPSQVDKEWDLFFADRAATGLPKQ